jgi:hypothetical protein
VWDERARGAPAAPSATKGNLRAVRAIARVSASSRPALPHCPLPTPRVALHRRRCRIGRFDAAGRRCAVVAQRPTLCQRRSSRCARSCGPVVRPPADTLHQVAAEGTSNQFTSFAEQSARRPRRSDAPAHDALRTPPVLGAGDGRSGRQRLYRFVLPAGSKQSRSAQVWACPGLARSPRSALRR